MKGKADKSSITSNLRVIGSTLTMIFTDFDSVDTTEASDNSSGTCLSPSTPSKFSFSLLSPSILFSFIDNIHDGIEVILVTLDRFKFEYDCTRVNKQFLMSIAGIQVDNYIRKAAHAVLLVHSQEGESGADADRRPFMRFRGIIKNGNKNSSFVVQLADLNVLPIKVMVDYRSVAELQKYVAIIVDEFMLREVNLQFTEAAWIDRLVADSISDDVPETAINASSRIIAETSLQRIHLERIIIHAFHVKVTYTSDTHTGTGTSAEAPFSWTDLLKNASSVENASFYWSNFFGVNVFSTFPALARNLQQHYSSETKKNFFNLIGSLSVIGAPAELVNNVGGGVGKFFTSPYAGLMEGGEKGFVTGMEEGLDGLRAGVVGGVAKSVGTMSDALNRSLAEYAGDDDYLSERDVQKRVFNRVAGSGIKEKMKKVGASLSLGFESGAHGIISLMGKESVTKEEVTRALAGLFIKPIVGLGDGLVETMKNFNEEKNFLQRRGRRTLMRKLGGGFEVLPYDDKVSAAEEVVECGGTVEDKYIFHTLCCKELLILR